MKKIICPICHKELIRLEPFSNGVYTFWCDNCNMDIVVTNNNEVENKDEFVNITSGVCLTDITGTIGEWLDSDFDIEIPDEVVKLLSKAYELSAKALGKFNDNEKRFIEMLEEAKKYVKGELELDNFDGEWFAMDYRADLHCAFPIEAKQYNKPLITDKEIKEKYIDFIKCCDTCDVSYV